MLMFAGCMCLDDYRYVSGVGPGGDAQLLERGQRKQLEVAFVNFSSGMGWVDKYLVEAVPSREDEQAVREVIEKTPPYRRPLKLGRGINRLYNSDGYPWHGRLHWIVGNEPLVIGLGGPQGREAAQRGRERNSRYPLIGSVDLDEPITHLLIFSNSKKLMRARAPEDAAKVPYDVVQLPQGTTLGNVLSARAGPATARAGP
ncbi:MAG: hypothetical protein WBD40_02775 [Tepidisphaeraceae bacterium]